MQFEIVDELGYSAILVLSKYKNNPTPWIINNGKIEGMNLNLKYIIMQNNGPSIIDINPEDVSGSNLMGSYTDNLHFSDFSVFLPLLAPSIARKYEFSIYLDRLDKIKNSFPDIFGLVFDLSDDISYLNELLKYKPTFVVIKSKPYEELSYDDVLALIRVREQIPRNIAIYMPGGAFIGYQSVMIALGIDFLDTASAYRASEKLFIMEDNFLKKSNNLSLKERNKVNVNEIFRDFYFIKKSLYNNELWTRIARDMHVNPSVATLVNQIKRKYLIKQETHRFPKYRDNTLYFTGDEGLYHPDIIEYRNRVINRYKIDSSKRVIILLPCSAKKPYRNSRTHKIYYKVIKDASRKINHIVEVWSLTSPLGVVPYPLETVYPAGNYDIPVTGFWSSEEIEITGSMLAKMLSKYKNMEIIVHVSEGYRGMIDYAFKKISIKPIISWIGDKPTSQDALNKFHQTINEVINKIRDSIVIDKQEDDKKKFSRLKPLERSALAELPAQICYTHGEKSYLNSLKNSLDSDIRLIGRPPRPIQIQKNKQHWITWDIIHGKVRLSMNAAKEIADTSLNWIICDMDKLNGSSLFAAGIIEASSAISPGDEVIILNKNKTVLLGVGTAIVSGDTMNNMTYGAAVKITKKGVLTL